MPMLRPTHTPTIGSLRSSAGTPVAGLRGLVTVPRHQAPYEQEPRHANRHGRFGPFFIGVHVLDWVLSGFGYHPMRVGRDARAHGGYSP